MIRAPGALVVVEDNVLAAVGHSSELGVVLVAVVGWSYTKEWVIAARVRA